MKKQLAHAAAIACIFGSQVRPVAAYEADLKHNKVTVTSVPDFDHCVQDFADSGGEACLTGLRAYVKAHPADAFAAGKSVRLNFNHWVALAFFDGPLNKPNPQQCADEDVRMAVISGLALAPADPNAKIARRIAAGPCWDALKPKLLAELTDGGAYYKENACPVFKERAVAADKCAPPVAAKPVEAAAHGTRSAKVANVKASTLTPDPTTALLFRGQEREEVLLVRPKGKDDVMLVKIKGVRGPWNNRILVTQENEGVDGHEYVANVDGDDYVVVTQIEGDYEVYPQGYRDGVHIRRVALTEETKSTSSSAIVTEFGTAK